MHKQIVVSMKDLRFATLLCSHCNTRVTLDFDAEFEPGTRHAPFNAPVECPRCANHFDSALPGAVNTMQKAYRAVAKLNDALTFTGDQDPEA